MLEKIVVARLNPYYTFFIPPQTLAQPYTRVNFVHPSPQSQAHSFEKLNLAKSSNFLNKGRNHNQIRGGN